jgi:hypothetical protein
VVTPVQALPSCAGKRAYATKRAGKLALRRMRAAYGATSVRRVYRCSCGSWHLTTEPQRKRPKGVETASARTTLGSAYVTLVGGGMRHADALDELARSYGLDRPTVRAQLRRAGVGVPS